MLSSTYVLKPHMYFLSTRSSENELTFFSDGQRGNSQNLVIVIFLKTLLCFLCILFNCVMFACIAEICVFQSTLIVMHVTVCVISDMKGNISAWLGENKRKMVLYVHLDAFTYYSSSQENILKES